MRIQSVSSYKASKCTCKKKSVVHTVDTITFVITWMEGWMHTFGFNSGKLKEAEEIGMYLIAPAPSPTISCEVLFHEHPATYLFSERLGSVCPSTPHWGPLGLHKWGSQWRGYQSSKDHKRVHSVPSRRSATILHPLLWGPGWSSPKLHHGCLCWHQRSGYGTGHCEQGQ